MRRMRRAGVLVRPRYAEGTTDVITGYSVATRPKYGERPIWYGGRQLGRDLSLPRLREEWPDDPTTASTAAAEWNAAKRHRRPVAPGRETHGIDPDTWRRYTEHLAAVREQLGSIPVQDHEAWARLARQSAGALSAPSGALEDAPGPIAHAADALARSAQTKRPAQAQRGSALPSIAGAAMLLATANRNGRGVMAEAALVHQMMRLVVVLAKVHEKSQELRRAEAIRNDTLARLKVVQDARTLEFGFADRIAQVAATDPELAASMRRREATQAGARGAGSPVPNRVEPTPEPRVTQRPERRGPRR